MDTKPTNLAELVRYLTLHSNLELDFDRTPMVVHGNLGPTVMPGPAAGLHKRTFVKRSGNQLVFLKGDGGGKTYSQFQSASEFTFFPDRFEVDLGESRKNKYYYRD